MNFDDILKLAPALAVGIGLAIFFVRQSRQNATLGAKLREQLATAESLALPELVTRIGMKDGFMNRGKVINALGPMVSSGEVIQEEPPGTTVKNRLDVLRFRLKSKPSA